MAQNLQFLKQSLTESCCHGNTTRHNHVLPHSLTAVDAAFADAMRNKAGNAHRCFLFEVENLRIEQYLIAGSKFFFLMDQNQGEWRGDRTLPSLEMLRVVPSGNSYVKVSLGWGSCHSINVSEACRGGDGLTKLSFSFKSLYNYTD